MPLRRVSNALSPLKNKQQKEKKRVQWENEKCGANQLEAFGLGKCEGLFPYITPPNLRGRTELSDFLTPRASLA